MNPGHPALEASTLPLGNRGGGTLHKYDSWNFIYIQSKYDCYLTQYSDVSLGSEQMTDAFNRAGVLDTL